MKLNMIRGERLLKGKCYYCSKELTERTIKRHMKTCPEMAQAIINKKRDIDIYREQFIISIKPKYDKDKYCIYLSIDENLSLGILDRFIRDNWVECCNHLSLFKIKGDIFELDEMEDFQIGALLEPEEKFEYVYDFGSSTELELEVVDVIQVPESYTQVELIARNVEKGSPREGVCGYIYDKAAEKKYLPGNEIKYKIKKQGKNKDSNEMSEEEYFNVLPEEVRNIVEDMAQVFEGLMVKEFSLDISKIIKALNKDDIYFMARRLGLEKISSLNKEKLIEKFLLEYEEAVEKKLQYFDEERYKILKGYADNDGLKSLDEVKEGLEELLYFRNLGMLFFCTKNRDEVIIFIPEIIKNSIKEKSSFEYRNRIKKNSEILRLHRGMMRAYGLIEYKELNSLFKRYGIESSNNISIEDLVDEGQYFYDYYGENNYYLSGEVSSGVELFSVREASEAKEYALIARNELLNLAEDNWTYEMKAGRRFYDNFLELFEVDRSVLFDLMETIYIDVQEAPPEEIIKLTLNMVAEEAGELAEITTGILKDYISNIRMWKYKGATLKEYEQEKQKNMKKALVGRNDPCPCGSGKKYKKCCGREDKIINLFQ